MDKSIKMKYFYSFGFHEKRYNSFFFQVLEIEYMELPPIPEKPLRFKKKQLEALLMGKINPSSEPLNRNNIKALLIPINNALKNASKEYFCENMHEEYDEVRS